MGSYKLEQYSIKEIGNILTKEGKSDLDGVGKTAESMRNHVYNVLAEGFKLGWHCSRWGRVELNLETSDNRLGFYTEAQITGANIKGSCVRFPKIDILLQEPNFKFVEIGGKIKVEILEGYGLDNGARQEMTKEYKNTPITEIIRELSTLGTELNKTHRDLILTRLSSDMVKEFCHKLGGIKLENYVGKAKANEYKLDLFNEDVRAYLINNVLEIDQYWKDIKIY